MSLKPISLIHFFFHNNMFLNISKWPTLMKNNTDLALPKLKKNQLRVKNI